MFGVVPHALEQHDGRPTIEPVRVACTVLGRGRQTVLVDGYGGSKGRWTAFDGMESGDRSWTLAREVWRLKH